MSPENENYFPEFGNLAGTELTLALPGISAAKAKKGTKRGFLAAVDLNLGRSTQNYHDDNLDGKSGNNVSSIAKPPAPKTQVVGWPPVRTSTKSITKGCKYVKVAVDGAAYLRKVDLEMYKSYQQLMRELEDMFPGLTIRNYLNESKIMEQPNGVEYVPTYQDRDGDWMLIGDVPWKTFVESCKRLRLMKSTDAVGLPPRTPPRCTSKS